MVTYSYKCQNCNQSFDISARKAEEISCHPKCPSCGSVQIMKVITMPPVFFKGKGFYSTDNLKETY